MWSELSNIWRLCLVPLLLGNSQSFLFYPLDKFYLSNKQVELLEETKIQPIPLMDKSLMSLQNSHLELLAFRLMHPVSRNKIDTHGIVHINYISRAQHI